ncbi:MAG: HD domain-containing phosphohydrolase [candidate division WOR-3 bacterium]
MKILCVEDNKEERYLLETILKHEGYEVVTAENGEKALEILQKELVDLIVSDILMPVMDGYSFLSICKQDEKLRDIPFIFYTATYTSAEDEELAKKLGVDYYIRKPVEVDEFIKLIKQIIDNFAEKRLVSRPVACVKTEVVTDLYNKVLINKLESKIIELEELKQNYNLLCEHIEDFIFWLDENGYFTKVNCQVKMFGYTPEDVVGHHFTEFLTPESQKIALAHFEKAKQSGGSADEYEVNVIGKDGEIFLLNLRLYTIRDNDRFLGRFGIGRDITKLRAAEKRLKNREAMYKILWENIPVGVFYYDQNLILTECNERCVQILQSSRDRLIGLDLNKLKDRRPLPAIRAVLEGKEGEYTGYYEVTTSPAVLYAELKCAPIYDEKHNIIGGVGLIHDITSQHEAEQQLIEILKKNQKFLEGTIHALASAVEKRDPYTAGHQKRVAQLACAIAQEMGLKSEAVESLKIAGILHDIGKIYVPAEILSKPARLTPAEYDIVKEHPRIGYEILAPIEFPWPIAQIILQHHERLNGSGYPAGLKMEQILLEARILAVADVVEAMMTHRPYRPAWSVEVALQEIIANQGILYDTRVVDACVKLFRVKNFKFNSG